MKKTRGILFYALIMGLLVLSNSCKKDEDNDDPKNVAVLTTADVTDITQTGAIAGGDITNDGGVEVTARGVCWGTSESPSINDSKTEDGKGEGNFTSQISELSSNTTYYVRAYATNSAGTGYGKAISFKTLEAITLSVLTTADVTEIKSSSAVSGGNITNDGGVEVTARGVCWSTSNSPTIDNYKTIDGENIGSFISKITDLNANTTYYVRAYATTIIGTSYGKETSFTTLDMVSPVITTAEVTNITPIYGVSGGNISSDGEATITARGVCWNTHTTPTIADSKSNNGTGIGSFSSEMSYLTLNTTYFVRAYATNRNGTFYGNEVSFTTENGVTDADGNVYETVTIGTQTWMARNLRTTKYNDGTPIEYLSKPESTAGYSWYMNDITTYGYSYGGLYNWYAVNSGKLCPAGWHVPTDAEWQTLVTFLGGEYVAGGKLKYSEPYYWSAPNTDATNSSGFGALPGGWSFTLVSSTPDADIYHDDIWEYGYWWSATEITSNAWYRSMSYSDGKVARHNVIKKTQMSVRCIKD